VHDPFEDPVGFQEPLSARVSLPVNRRMITIIKIMTAEVTQSPHLKSLKKVPIRISVKDVDLKTPRWMLHSCDNRKHKPAKKITAAPSSSKCW
jgi:hypothetical protein